MNFRFKKIYSWLLMTIIAMSAVQSATAMGFSQNSQEQECQMMQMSLSDTSGMQADYNCPMEQGESNCIDTECITSSSITELQTSHALLSVTGAESRQKILTRGNAILRHYPELLQRPPRA
jgi:hypothetical protein